LIPFRKNIAKREGIPRDLLHDVMRETKREVVLWGGEGHRKPKAAYYDELRQRAAQHALTPWTACQDGNCETHHPNETKPHELQPWTACYDDKCWIHKKGKDKAGWYPKRPQRQVNMMVTKQRPTDDATNTRRIFAPINLDQGYQQTPIKRPQRQFHMMVTKRRPADDRMNWRNSYRTNHHVPQWMLNIGDVFDTHDTTSTHTPPWFRRVLNTEEELMDQIEKETTDEPHPEDLEWYMCLELRCKTCNNEWEQAYIDFQKRHMGGKPWCDQDEEYRESLMT
jgi:hypothetical protein